MAFNSRSLCRGPSAPVGSVAGSSNLNQVHRFLYGTDDAAATVEASGYFNNARGLITVGSLIDAAMAVGGGAPVFKCYVVTAVPATTGNVTIALQTTTAG